MKNNKFIQKLPKRLRLFLMKRKEEKRVRILKQLHARVKFTEILHNKKIQYRILSKDKNNKWEERLSTTSASKAIHRKHNLWMIVLRDLGYRGQLIEKRKKRYKN